MFHVRSIWRSHTLSKNLKKCENVNDANIISMPMFAAQLVNKVKIEQIIVFMGNRESAFLKKGMFFSGTLRSSVRVSHGSENFGVRY